MTRDISWDYKLDPPEGEGPRRCEMILDPMASDAECQSPAVGWYENVPVCSSCAAAMREEGLSIDMERR